MQVADNITNCVGMGVRWIVIVLIAIVLIETVGRYAFAAPTVWGHELGQMLFGCYMLFGGAYVLRYDAHVRFDTVYRKLPPRRRGILNCITELLFFAYCIAIMWWGVPYFWKSFLIDEHTITRWGPPLWPIKMLVPIAVFLLLVQGSATYVRNLYAAITGKELT